MLLPQAANAAAGTTRKFGSNTGRTSVKVYYDLSSAGKELPQVKTAIWLYMFLFLAFSISMPNTPY